MSGPGYGGVFGVPGAPGGSLPLGTQQSDGLLWTGLTWIPSLQEYNVKAFGAAGDGVTDDTSAVQDAFNEAATTGGSVYFPSGTYLITSPLTVRSSAALPVTIRGNGYGSFLNVILPGVDTAAIAFIDATLAYLTIEHIRLGGTFSRGIDLRNGIIDHVVIRDNYIADANEPPGGGVNAGIAISNASDVWIEYNELSNNGGGAAVAGYDILKDAGTITSRIHVRNNRVIGAGCQIAIALFDCNDSDATGNVVNQGNIGNILGGSGYGIMFYGATGTIRRNQVSQNYVTNTAGSGIYLQASEDSVVSDNVLFDVVKILNDPSLPQAGIAINTSRCSTTGNVVKQSTRDGIAITSVRNTVGRNTVETAVHGIRVQGICDNSSIEGNICTGVSNGVVCVNAVASEGLTIAGNALAGTGGGVSWGAGVLNFSTIANNYCVGFQVNIFVISGAQNTITGNVCRVATQDNIDYRGSNSIIANNICQAATGRGIFCSGAQVNVLNNECVANGGLAVSITGANSWGEKNRVSAAGPMRGLAVLVAGTVVVATAEILAGDIVRLTRTVPGAGVTGDLSLGAIVAGVNFTINSNAVTDVSTVFWEIVH